MKLHGLLHGGSAMLILAGLGACTTPAPYSGLLTDYSGLGDVQGRLGQRAELRPTRPVSPTTTLVLETIAYAPGARDASRLPERSTALLLNHFARELCGRLSPSFEVSTDGNAQAYRLRAYVTEVQATGMLGASVSTPLSVLLPVGGRVPIGLGAFSAEMEVLDPAGRQVAAMVWRRRADMTMEASLSRISDAYALSEEAAEAFAKTFQTETTGGQIMAGARALSPITFRGRTDQACDAYGQPRALLGDVVSIFAPPLPPEVLDPGASSATDENQQ